MKIFFLVIAATLLTACASSKSVQGPSGGTAFFIKCGAGVLEACYKEAATVCPSGYRIVDSQKNRGPNSMLIECKP